MTGVGSKAALMRMVYTARRLPTNGAPVTFAPMPSPFREQRLSPAEVRRVLRRALELAEARGDSGPALTLAEIARHADALGIATAGVEPAPPAPPPRVAGGLWGAPAQLVLEEELSGELGPEHHEDVVEAIRQHLGDGGNVNVLDKTLSWSPSDPSLGVRVRVRARYAVTRIHIEQKLSAMTSAVWIVGGFLGVLAGSGAAALTVGTGGSVPAAVLAVAAVVLALAALCRSVVAVLAQRTRARLHRLFARIRALVHEGLAPHRRARIVTDDDLVRAEAEAEELALAEASGVRHGAGQT
jgi:hypothetical protein